MRKSSDLLINIRLCFCSVSILHLIFAAIMILSIDMSHDEDPRISVYIHVRWKLITCWFNLLLLAYFPISLYCDRKEKQGKWNEERVRFFRKVRDYMMTGILFPITMFSDVTFWLLWVQDPALIAPVAIFSYLPVWAQHSLHTLSAVKVILDILLLPRRRPSNCLPNAAMTVAFTIIYGSMLAISQVQGEIIYSFFEVFSRIEIMAFVLFSFSQISFFYVIQWHIIEFIWGGKPHENGFVNGGGNQKIKSH